MTDLHHEFLLLSREQYPYAEYMQWINNPKAIHLHDDLMHYLDDSLRWITCYNPAKRMLRHKGLNFYGPTVIKSDGAVVLQRILSGWSEIFSSGPKRINLTGPYERREGETGSHTVIKLDRDVVVKTLNRLSNYAQSVSQSEDKLYILHLGM